MQNKKRIAISIVLILVICLLVLIRRNYFSAIVSGSSMEPVLQNNDKLLVKRTQTIKRFDIILATDSQGKVYVKRVIGLPGERLKFSHDCLYINGKLAKEKYLHRSASHAKGELLTSDFPQTNGTYKIPAGKYFLMGDNRIVSKDSRMFGPVKKKAIKGKVVAIIAPSKRIKILRSGM